MATSKNANKHTKSTEPGPKTLVGRKVMYLGNGVTMVCPSCGLSRGRGMVSEVKGTFFCSEGCARKG